MTDIAPPRAQAPVTYYSGMTVASATPALIEWGADERIRIWTLDTGAPVLVLDAAPSEITVKGNQSVLNLVVGGRPHRIDFAPVARAVSTFGIIGAVAAQPLVREAGVPQWIESLRQAGAQIRYRKPWVRVVLTLGVIVLIVAAIATLFAVMMLN